MLQRASLAEDPYLHEVLYNTLIDLQATSDLLALDTSYLEKHLKTNGGLPSGVVEGPIGPLTPSQVAPYTWLRLSAPRVYTMLHETQSKNTTGSSLFEAGFIMKTKFASSNLFGNGD